MAVIIKLAQEHQCILRALEVLRLISDRLEKTEVVEAEDVRAVLGVLKDVGQRCLDNTEKSLLVPAMNYVADPSDRGRVSAIVAAHHEISNLLKEMDTCFQNGCSDEFVSISRRLISTLGDLIYFEDHFLIPLVSPVVSDQKNRQLMAEFEQTEQWIAEQARPLTSALHRLELKYINPHCI
jgi:hemerythrin-like domain-containing protein